MKTLDEVIAIFEKACDLEQRCADCEGCLGQESGCPNDGANAVPDALHYLKEYRDRKETLRNWTEKAISEQQNLSDAITFMQAYRDDKDDLTALRAYWAEQQANPALTWEELKSMEGKPVWIETKTKGGRWMILSYFGDVYKSDDTVMFASGYNGGTSTCYKKNMGITWQAYRKERK